MSASRREFLALSTLSVLGAAAGLGQNAGQQNPPTVPQTTPTPGAPPAFGTAPPFGPEVTAADFEAAEKLVNFTLTEAERAQAASNWRISLAPYYERRVGPRKVAIEPSIAPWSQWNPVMAGQSAGPERDRFVRSSADVGPLPATDEAIAFSPVYRLARWMEQRQITSERLTGIYLERLERFDPQLRCVITLDPRPCPGAGAAGGQGNCRRTLPRSAARHSVGRKGPAGYGGHPDDLRGRALPQPHSRRGRRRDASACTGRAQCWWPSFRWARWRSMTSGSAGRR